MSDLIYFVKPVYFPLPYSEKYRAYVVYEAGQDILDITPLKGFQTLKEAQAYRDKLDFQAKKKEPHKMNSKLNKDWQYPLVVVFALRYALGRHSCAPSIVSSYIREHWDELQQQHDGILEDIREHLEYCKEWQEDACNSIDYATWQKLYNELTHRTKQ